MFGHGHTSAPLWFYRSPLLHRNPVKWGSRLRIGATCQDYCRGLLFQANPAPLPAPEQHLTSTPPIPHLRGCAGWALFIACPVIGFGLYGVMPHGSAYGETPLLAGQQRPISRQLMIPRETGSAKRPRLMPIGCGSLAGICRQVPRLAAKLRGESVVLSPLGLGNRDKRPCRVICSRLGAALPGGPLSHLGPAYLDQHPTIQPFPAISFAI